MFVSVTVQSIKHELFGEYASALLSVSAIPRQEKDQVIYPPHKAGLRLIQRKAAFQIQMSQHVKRKLIIQFSTLLILGTTQRHQ